MSYKKTVGRKNTQNYRKRRDVGRRGEEKSASHPAHLPPIPNPAQEELEKSSQENPPDSRIFAKWREMPHHMSKAKTAI